MFGFSFGEFVLICVVALVAVGPQKLPGLLRTLGQWIRKARNVLHDMRAQSGIDDILRAEGLHGGLNELRSLVRTNASFPADLMAAATAPVPPVVPPSVPPPPSGEDLYGGVDIDPSKEYPPEGADAYGALPDDLVSDVPAYPLPAAAMQPASPPVEPEKPTEGDALLPPRPETPA